MPFTPFHFGPSATIAFPLRGKIDIPVFILANVAIGIEPLTVMILNLSYPLHGYAHSFLGGGLASDRGKATCEGWADLAGSEYIHGYSLDTRPRNRYDLPYYVVLCMAEETDTLREGSLGKALSKEELGCAPSDRHCWRRRLWCSSCDSSSTIKNCITSR